MVILGFLVFGFFLMELMANYCGMRNKTLQDLLLLENIQLQGDRNTQHSSREYFHITEQNCVFLCYP